LESVLRAPDAAVELACPRKEPLEWSRVPDASVVQTPHCLAALSVPMLLELAATGKTLWLNDAICHACPIGQASDAIRQAVDTANRWLQASGHGAALQSYRSAAHRLADEPAGRPAERSSSSTMSRRDFFRSFTRLREGGAAGSAAESATGDTHEPAAAGQAEELHTEYVEGQGPRLPHHIPAQRQRLAAVLGLLARDPSAPVSSQGLPIADVQATDSCTACSLCTQFCPTEALSFVSDEAYYVLNFSAALCLGEECSLCVIGCPVDAVRFGSQVAMEELLSTQPRPIKAGRLTPCARCGMLTGAPLETDEAPLCYVCQAQAARPSLLARSQAPSDGKTES
jgi:ferredoxin